jgi:hypothetical protein
VALPAAEEAIAFPTRPTPAFVPRDNGACMRAYRLVEDTCVHRYYEQNHAGDMARSLAAYRRGVAPPMLGPVPLPPGFEKKPKAPLGPGSLSKPRLDGDAGSPRDRRLAELDVMLAAAREKLRQRDEAAKAKKVDDPKPASGTGAPSTAGATAANHSALTTGPGSSASDPTLARMNELSQIATQLSGEQLRALTAELGKTGINTSALEDILRTEGGDDTRR